MIIDVDKGTTEQIKLINKRYFDFKQQLLGELDEIEKQCIAQYIPEYKIGDRVLVVNEMGKQEIVYIHDIKMDKELSGLNSMPSTLNCSIAVLFKKCNADGSISKHRPSSRVIKIISKID